MCGIDSNDNINVMCNCMILLMIMWNGNNINC